MTMTTAPKLSRRFTKREVALLNLLHDIRDLAEQLEAKAKEARAEDFETFVGVTRNEHEPDGDESAAHTYLMCLDGIPFVADGIYGIIDSYLPRARHYRPDAAE